MPEMMSRAADQQLGGAGGLAAAAAAVDAKAPRNRDMCPYAEVSVLIERLLEKHGGNQSAAAAEIGYTAGVFRGWLSANAVPKTARLAMEHVLQNYGNGEQKPPPLLSDAFSKDDLERMALMATAQGAYELAQKILGVLSNSWAGD